MDMFVLGCGRERIILGEIPFGSNEGAINNIGAIVSSGDAFGQ